MNPVLKALKEKETLIKSSEDEAKKFLLNTGVYTPKFKIKKIYRKKL